MISLNYQEINLIFIKRYLYRFYENLPEFIAWATEKKLLVRQYSCFLCDSSVILDYKNNMNGAAELLNLTHSTRGDFTNNKYSVNYRCMRKKEHRRSVFHNSIFSNSKMPFVNILIILYGFAYDLTYDDIIRESLSNSAVSSATIAKYFNLFRELLFGVVEDIKNEVDLLGIDGGLIEVDETFIGTRKYNRGRNKNTQWVVGMLERKTNNIRFEKVDNRDCSTLLNVLKKYIHPKATIVTDYWKGYNNIKTYFSDHKTVNHSTNFISPETGAHTQTIECHWRLLKQRVYVQHLDMSNESKLTLRLTEFIYRHYYRKLDRNLFAVQMISDICNMYSNFVDIE